MTEPAKPVFKQQLTMHLNGGSKFSELHYAILRDDRPTGIRRHKRTDGRPKYLITEDVFFKGEEYFDILATKGVGIRGWLESHSVTEEATP